MGGSEALSKYHTTKCEELHLEKHCVQIWGAQSIDIRQFDNTLFKDFVNTSKFKIITPHLPTHKQTVRPKLQTDPC